MERYERERGQRLWGGGGRGWCGTRTKERFRNRGGRWDKEMPVSAFLQSISVEGRERLVNEENELKEGELWSATEGRMKRTGQRKLRGEGTYPLMSDLIVPSIYPQAAEY